MFIIQESITMLATTMMRSVILCVALAAKRALWCARAVFLCDVRPDY